MADTTSTSADVLDYYARNWERIAQCYELDDTGLPVDPAWYRRRLYQEFLERARPKSVLDIGCGGGWTVLDALERGVDARGIEPVAELQAFGSQLLSDKGHDGGRIARDDLASLTKRGDASEDCIALLSVLPHVPASNWDQVHSDIARTVRPGGRFIAAYRNSLFDLYTFNSFTLEFYDRELWAGTPHPAGSLDLLKALITNPDVPGPYFTAARDRSFGKLDRVKSNPLTMGYYLGGQGFTVDRISYYHFHCVPPLIADRVPEYRAINHEMELSQSTDWRGMVMAAIFVVEATRQ